MDFSGFDAASGYPDPKQHLDLSEGERPDPGKTRESLRTRVHPSRPQEHILHFSLSRSQLIGAVHGVLYHFRKYNEINL